jgi:hypothetical protein
VNSSDAVLTGTTADSFQINISSGKGVAIAQSGASLLTNEGTFSVYFISSKKVNFIDLDSFYGDNSLYIIKEDTTFPKYFGIISRWQYDWQKAQESSFWQSILLTVLSVILVAASIVALLITSAKNEEKLGRVTGELKKVVSNLDEVVVDIKEKRLRRPLLSICFHKGRKKSKQIVVNKPTPLDIVISNNGPSLANVVTCIILLPPALELIPSLSYRPIPQKETDNEYSEHVGVQLYLPHIMAETNIPIEPKPEIIAKKIGKFSVPALITSAETMGQEVVELEIEVVAE